MTDADTGWLDDEQYARTDEDVVRALRARAGAYRLLVVEERSGRATWWIAPSPTRCFEGDAPTIADAQIAALDAVLDDLRAAELVTEALRSVLEPSASRP